MRQLTRREAHPLLIHTFTRKLLVSNSILLGLALLFGTAIFLLEWRQYSVGQMAQSTQQDIDALYSSMVDQETGLRGYITSADPVFLEPFYRGKRLYRMASLHLQRQLQASEFSNAEPAFESSTARAQDWSNTFASREIQLMERKEYSVPRSPQEELWGKALFDRFRDVASVLRNTVRRDAQVAQAQSLALNLWSLVGMVLFFALSLVLLWLLGQQNVVALEQQMRQMIGTMTAWKRGETDLRMEALRYQELQLIAWNFHDVLDLLVARGRELERQQKSLLVVLNASPQMIWVARADGWIEMFNRRWYEYTGTSKEQVGGWAWRESSLVHPDDLAVVEESWKSALAQGSSYEFQFRIRCAYDNCYHWHLGRALPVRDQDGTIFEWIGTLTDIDVLKEVEQALVQANEEQRAFMSTVSHEFRTTLTGIQGFSEMLGTEDFSEPEVKEFAQDIYRDATRLNRMITDLLDLERMRSGRTTLHLEKIDFKQLIRQVVEKLPALSSQHQVEVQVDEGLPELQGDRDKLIQVLYNLLTNAVKYSPEGGMIVVEVKQEGEKMHMQVCDQGIGIPEEAVEAIFRPYNRIDTQETRFIKGTGLGLPIVHSLIELHGGRIWVESSLGRGSCFHVVLPLSQSDACTGLNVS